MLVELEFELELLDPELLEVDGIHQGVVQEVHAVHTSATVGDPPVQEYPEAHPLHPVAHPIPLSVPSSQTSIPAHFPSPQVVVHTDGSPVQVYPFSTVHEPEHPSPLLLFPSSQFSPPAANMNESPHIPQHHEGPVALPPVQIQ